MRFDRNLNASGKGKYAVIKLRRIPTDPRTPQELAAAILASPECVEFGEVGSAGEFMVVMLKDENADAGLFGYAGKALIKDPEYAYEVAEMAKRAGPNNPFCKVPD